MTAVHKFTAEELLARRKYIGGSDANILMGGEPDAIHALWMRKTGREQEPDLSDVLAVQLGIHTEPLNAEWYSRTTGRAVTSRNKLCRSARHYWMAANVDGLTSAPSDQVPALWEAKWMGAFGNLDATVQRYQPQLAHNMLVCGVERAVLSVITGKPSYELFEVELDEFFAAQLVEREKLFWECVERDEPPGGFQPIAAPIPVETMREVSMAGSNEWAWAAVEWMTKRAPAKEFEAAAKAIKALVPADAKKAHGHSIIVTRDKKGALTIKENLNHA